MTLTSVSHAYSKWLPATCCSVSYSNTRQSFNPGYYSSFRGTRNILPTKTDDAGAAAQPKRRGRGAVRRANGLSADSTLDFRCRFARHRASPASFRPSGRPRAVGHETLRVTKGHENARPSVVSDNRRCQAAQAASGNANSRGRKGHLLMFLMWAKRPFSLIALGKRSAFIIFFIAVFLSLAIGNIVIGNTSTS